MKHLATIVFFILYFSLPAIGDETFMIWNVSDGLKNNFVNAIARDDKGQLWISTEEGAAIIKNDGVTTFNISDTLKVNMPQEIRRALSHTISSYHSVTDSKGRLWVYNAFGHGLKSHDKGTILFPDLIIKSVVTRKNGGLIVGTNDKGIFFVDDNGSIYRHMEKISGNNNSLPSNHINCLMYDSEHDLLWVGTNNGLAVTTVEGMAHRAKAHAVHISSDVSAFFISNNGSTWIGTDGNGLINPQGERVGWFNNVTGIFQLNRDTILCSTYGDGIVAVNINSNQCAIYRNLSSESPLAFTRKIVRGLNNELWISTFRSGLGCQSRGSLTMFTTQNSPLATNFLTGIDRAGDSLKISTGAGLYSVDMKSHSIQRIDMSETPYTCMLISAEGQSWYGTRSGLLTPDSLWHTDEVKAIAEDKYGNIWFTTDNELCFYRHGQCSFRYCSVDGLSLGKFARYALTVVGDTLYAGCEGGFLTIALSDSVPPMPMKEIMLKALSTSKSESHALLWTVVAALIALCATSFIYILRKRHKVSEKSKVGDTAFVNKTNALVAEKLKDEDFTVDTFAAEMGMSRSGLYKKLMAELGITPSEYLRNARLERGKQLLDSGVARVNEVAFAVGMSPKQFSQFFKSKYGELPSAYLAHR